MTLAAAIERWSQSSRFWAGLTLAVALLVNMGDLRNPRSALWDESYYLTSTQRYLEGRAQYASHPPLGIMLMAGGAKLVGINDPALTHPLAALKKVSGEQIPDAYDFFGIRFASALCGTLASVGFFGMLLWQTARPRVAALLTIPILFDNALIVQFRAAQLDGPQVLFTVLALWAFLGALRRVRWAHMAFGTCVGLATMVRLNGVLLLLLGIAILWSDIREDGLRAGRLRDIAAMLLPFLAVVVVVMLAHVLVTPMLPAFDEAGRKDLPFMTPRYQEWLRSGSLPSPAVLWDASAGYWRFIMADLSGMTRVDPNGSHPLLWPLGQKTITYRWVAGAHNSRYVQMVPNLLGWWLAAAGIAFALLADLPRLFTRKRGDGVSFDGSVVALTLWYLMFMGFNVLLAQARVMYIYHYFEGLIVAYLVLALLVCRVIESASKEKGGRNELAATLGAAVIGVYWWLFPLTYNVRLSDRLCSSYNLVVPVVRCITPN